MIIGLVSFFMVLSGTPAQAGTIDLPQTGQTTCYTANGATESCLGTGQDGDWLAGVSWPVPRFSLYNNYLCFIDNLTGLVWTSSPRPFIATNWDQALVNVSSLSICGCFPWVIPNINQLQSITNAEWSDNREWLLFNKFDINVLLDFYWSSTLSSGNIADAWSVSLIDGIAKTSNRLSNNYGVWPVCVPTNPPPEITPAAEIWKTGQTVTGGTNDDGALRLGVAWPEPRFSANGECVTDNLTGLMWVKDANIAGLKTWNDALTFTNDITICGYVDWRLPNSKELFSLIDRSQSGPALPASYPFTGAQSDPYWSSTTYASDSTKAWTVDMLLGDLLPLIKTSQTAFVWPVRGGQTKPYTLIIKKEGGGKGKITAQDLTCVGDTCRGYYMSYDVVTVTATAQTGSAFIGWSGDACSGITDTTCAITVTADMTAAATFVPEYKISVSPKSLKFKNLKQSVESSPLSVTVKNVGVADLLIGLPVLAGDSPSVFTITDNSCTAALSYNESCAITVTATPPDYDQKSAELQIPSNDPKALITIVKLKAKAKPPKITKKPGTLNFGKVALLSPIDKTLTLTNKGTTDLVIGAMTVTGENQGDFDLVLPGTCPTLATGEQCELTVRFTPSAADKRSAILNIPSNDPKKQPFVTVNLKGRGE